MSKCNTCKHRYKMFNKWDEHNPCYSCEDDDKYEEDTSKTLPTQQKLRGSLDYRRRLKTYGKVPPALS